jgi:hypothetical protein
VTKPRSLDEIYTIPEFIQVAEVGDTFRFFLDIVENASSVLKKYHGEELRVANVSREITTGLGKYVGWSPDLVETSGGSYAFYEDVTSQVKNVNIVFVTMVSEPKKDSATAEVVDAIAVVEMAKAASTAEIGFKKFAKLLQDIKYTYDEYKYVYENNQASYCDNESVYWDTFQPTQTWSDTNSNPIEDIKLWKKQQMAAYYGGVTRYAPTDEKLFKLTSYGYPMPDPGKVKVEVMSLGKVIFYRLEWEKDGKVYQQKLTKYSYEYWQKTGIL